MKISIWPVVSRRYVLSICRELYEGRHIQELGVLGRGEGWSCKRGCNVSEGPCQKRITHLHGKQEESMMTGLYEDGGSRFRKTNNRWQSTSEPAADGNHFQP